MQNVNISELRNNLLKYLKIAQQGEQINITSKGLLLATLSPPITQQESANIKLKELAKTAIINDIVSPIENRCDAMK